MHLQLCSSKKLRFYTFPICSFYLSKALSSPHPSASTNPFLITTLRSVSSISPFPTGLCNPHGAQQCPAHTRCVLNRLLTNPWGQHWLSWSLFTIYWCSLRHKYPHTYELGGTSGAGVLNCGTTDILNQIILCVREHCPVHRETFSRIPGLHLRWWKHSLPGCDNQLCF